MVTNSKSDDKILRKIVISYSEFDSEIAEEIKNYFEKNKIDNFEFEFEEHPIGQNAVLVSKSISDVINGNKDCLVIIFSQNSMNEEWLMKDAKHLGLLGMPQKSIGVIVVNWYVHDSKVPEEISNIQRFKFDKDKGNMGGLMQTLINVVKIEIEEKA